MQYDGLAWGTGLLALVALMIALRILLKTNWFLGWLRGTCGLAFFALSGFVVLVALDLGRYSTVPQNQPLATISMKEDGPQRFRVTLTQGADDQSFYLDGDLWQLDVRLFQWKGLAALIGLEPGYRLEKISGRYLAIEQQGQALNSRIELAPSRYGIDLWRWLRLGKMHHLFLFDPQARRVNYLPMVDDAMFSISLAPTGLLVEPLNHAAKQALKDWQ